MKIVVVRKAGGLGDVICCEPVIRGLRKRYPHADITFLFQSVYQALFEDRKEAHYKPLHYVRMNMKWMKKYCEDADTFIDLCGPESNDENDGSPLCSRIESFCNYAGVEATSPRLDLSREEQKKAQQDLGIYPKPWTGFGVNGRQWAKNWPPEHWQELADKLPGTVFYFDESKLCDLGGKIVPIVGKSLREAMCLVSVMDLMITVDTGLLHLSTAIGVKTLSLWGPTDPYRTLKHYKDAYFVDPAPYRESSGCPKPCLHNPWNCGQNGENLSKCMTALKPDTIAEQAVEILRGNAVPVELRQAKKAEYYKSGEGIPQAEEGKRRVVFVAKHLLPPIGGAERSALEMLKALRDDGNDVVAVWSHPESSSFRHLSIEQADGITWVQTPEGVMLNKVLAADPDIVITQLSTASDIPKVLPKCVPLFLVLRSVCEHFCPRADALMRCVDGSAIDLERCDKHCIYSDDTNKPYDLMKNVYRCADEVFANSNAMARVFKHFTGRTCNVQYPVIDRNRVKEAPHTTKEFCVAIRPDAGRGADFLHELASYMPDEQFLWVDGPVSKLLNVQTMGETDDIGSVFEKALVVLSPHTAYEAFGRVPVEAGMVGIPSIVSPNGGLPESVGEGGYVVSLEVRRWASKIRKLRRSEKTWAEKSDAASKHARSFDWGVLLEKIHEYCPEPMMRPLQTVLSKHVKHRNGGGRKVLLVSHNNLLHKTRGGEKSMLHIMRYLRDFGYNCHIIMPKRMGEDSSIDFNITRVKADHNQDSWTVGARDSVAEVFDEFKPDVVLTWSSPSKLVKELCAERELPYVLFVRTLPKIAQLHSSGCLNDASAVITNCKYTSELLKAEYSLESVCSYVPSSVPKIAEKSSREYLTIIGAEKARKFLNEVAPQMQNQEFLVVDYSATKPFQRHNVHYIPYRNDLTDVWSQTDILLFPASEDMSGTSHTTMEAMIQGIPAIVQDRTSLAELNFLTVHQDANIAEWKTAIDEVQTDWQSYSDRARQFAFENHDPRRETERVRQVIESVMPSKGRALIWLEEGLGNIIEGLPTVEAVTSLGYEVDAVVVPTTIDTADLISMQPYLHEVFLDGSRLKEEKRHEEIMPDLDRYDVLLSCHRSHGFHGAKNVIRRVSSPHDKPEREWYISLANELGYRGSMPKAMLFCERKWRNLPVDAVAVPPGAVSKGWVIKRWDGYEGLLQYFDTLVLLGHEDDIFPQERKWMESTVNLIGQLSLPQTVSVLSQCKKFVGHDCGLAHVAAALGVPTFVIFGPTSHVKNLPEDAVLIRREPLELCQPCQYTSRFLKCCDRKCLMELTAEDVFAQVNESSQATGGAF